MGKVSNRLDHVPTRHPRACGDPSWPQKRSPVRWIPAFAGMTAIFVALLSLTACNAFDRASEIGNAPKLASIDDPTHRDGYVPVKMPMPPPSLNERQPNSLWETGGRAFFRDQRAGRVGDILTVVVTINDQAQIANETKRSRANSDDANLTNFFGLETKLNKLLPGAVDPSSLVKMGSDTSNDGKGSIGRQEQIDLRIAATIIQVLPNGNLVISGKQQVGVDYDMRDLEIGGIIRPQDISASNTITYDQIAEARINYGGKGTINDVQQPRYGDQLYDILMPF
ncbi:MAG: flagellar basal body L-ring protein FlgH [Alphaproteobacteria bacterium]|nr:flagellar basal body L-ring protein FlgH [Alphaproteobacteria bacterium]